MLLFDLSRFVVLIFGTLFIFGSWFRLAVGSLWDFFTALQIFLFGLSLCVVLVFGTLCILVSWFRLVVGCFCFCLLMFCLVCLSFFSWFWFLRLGGFVYLFFWLLVVLFGKILWKFSQCFCLVFLFL